MKNDCHLYSRGWDCGPTEAKKCMMSKSEDMCERKAYSLILGFTFVTMLASFAMIRIIIGMLDLFFA